MDFKDQILQLAERIQKQKDSIATEEQLPDGVVYMDKESGVVTTQEELDAYNIVRSILRKSVDVARETGVISEETQLLHTFMLNQSHFIALILAIFAGSSAFITLRSLGILTRLRSSSDK